MKTKITEKEIEERGTSMTVDFKLQQVVLKIQFQESVVFYRLSCNEAYHIWSLFRQLFTNKEMVEKIKVYNKEGEEINLVKTLFNENS